MGPGKSIASITLVVVTLAGCGSTSSAPRTVAQTGPQSDPSAGATSSGATSTSAVDPTKQPLPRPSGVNVIPAASPRSLFKTRNLLPVLDDLSGRLGSQSSVTNLAIYPGEIDLVVDESDGFRRVRIEYTGMFTESQPIDGAGGRTSMYMSQFSAAAPQTMAKAMTRRYHVPLSSIDRIQLVPDLPDRTAGMRAYTIPTPGRRQQMFLAQMDGTGLTRG